MADRVRLEFTRTSGVSAYYTSDGGMVLTASGRTNGLNYESRPGPDPVRVGVGRLLE